VILPIVCHIITGLSTGGAERALARLLTHGLQSEFENHVICLGTRGPQADVIERIGVPVHILGAAHPIDAIRGFSALHGILKDMRPSLLQGWMYHGNLAALTARGMLGGHIGVSWNIRQSLDDFRREKFTTQQVIRLSAWLSRLPGAIIYNSSVSAREHENFGFSSRKQRVIYNGFEVEKVRPSAEQGIVARERYGIPQNCVLVAHVARWHPMKDHHSFLAAAAACAADEEHCHFLLVGRNVAANATPLIAHLPEQSRARFHIYDEVADPLEVMQAADMLVLSSNSEGFPNVLGEAMMTSTACITTNVGECPRVVGDAGLVVPASDPRALRDAMITVIRDPALTRSMGIEGRKRVQQLYDIKTIVGQYDAVYRQLLDTDRTA
jgi:glycosyltransferase involved in cell wall biosynthesis